MKVQKESDEEKWTRINEYVSGEVESYKSRKEKELRLKLLEIASNCSVPGEASSRTIERALEFKKFIQDNE